jgi:hypothetical protein
MIGSVGVFAGILRDFEGILSYFYELKLTLANYSLFLIFAVSSK